MSSKVFRTTIITIVVLSLLGFWFGSKELFFLGALAFLFAAMIFSVTFILDGRPSEEQRGQQWEIARDQGTIRYLLRSIGRASMRQLPFMAIVWIVNFGNWQVLVLIFGLMLVGAVVIPIAEWYLNERRFGNVLRKPIHNTPLKQTRR